MKKILKAAAALPLVVLIPALLAGTAVAAWLLLGSSAVFSGSGSSADAIEPIVLSASTTATAIEGTGPDTSLTCSLVTESVQEATISIAGADVDYSGDDNGVTNDDGCAYTSRFTVGDGYILNGLRLVVDGVAYDSSNMSAAPFILNVKRDSLNGAAATTTDGCLVASGGAHALEYDLVISELNSSPGVAYDFSGTAIEVREIGSVDVCASSGL